MAEPMLGAALETSLGAEEEKSNSSDETTDAKPTIPALARKRRRVEKETDENAKTAPDRYWLYRR